MPPYNDRDDETCSVRDEPARQPEAQEMVRRYRDQLMKFREQCRLRIAEHQEAIEFWQKELAITSEFLSDNQLDRPEKAELKSRDR